MDKTLEQRVADVERQVGWHSAKLEDMGAWGAGENGQRATQSPTFGFEPSGPVSFCQNCGEPPDSHVCPKVKEKA